MQTLDAPGQVTASLADAGQAFRSGRRAEALRHVAEAVSFARRSEDEVLRQTTREHCISLCTFHGAWEAVRSILWLQPDETYIRVTPTTAQGIPVVALLRGRSYAGVRRQALR